MIEKPEADSKVSLVSTDNIDQEATALQLITHFRSACQKAANDLSIEITKTRDSLAGLAIQENNRTALIENIKKYPEDKTKEIKEVDVQKTKHVVEPDCWELGYKCSNRCVHEYDATYWVKEYRQFDKPILSWEQNQLINNLNNEKQKITLEIKKSTDHITELKNYQGWLKNHASNLLCPQATLFNAKLHNHLLKSPKAKESLETLHLFTESELKDHLKFYEDFKEVEGVTELTIHLVTNANLLPFLKLMKEELGEGAVEEFLLSFLKINLRRAENNSIIQYYILLGYFTYNKFFDNHFLETVYASTLGNKLGGNLNENSLDNLIYLFQLSTDNDFYKNKVIMIFDNKGTSDQLLQTLINYANKISSLNEISLQRTLAARKPFDNASNLKKVAAARKDKITKQGQKRLDAKEKHLHLIAEKKIKLANKDKKQIAASDRREKHLSQIKAHAQGNYRYYGQMRFKTFFSVKNNKKVMHVSLALHPSLKKLDLLNQKHIKLHKEIERKEVSVHFLQEAREKQRNQKNQELNKKRQERLNQHHARIQENLNLLHAREQKNNYLETILPSKDLAPDYAKALDRLNEEPLNKKFFKGVNLDCLKIFYQLINKMDEKLYPNISHHKFQVLGNCREEALIALQQLVANCNNDKDKVHLLNNARNLPLFAQHRNQGFFKTIGRTNSVIKIDNMISNIKENQIKHTYLRH